MIHFVSDGKTNLEETINPLVAWLAPSSILIGGLVGIAFSVAISGASWSGDTTDAITSESTPQGMVLGARALHPMPTSIVALRSPVRQRPSAFGYLEFDWDPDAPGGVPGFEAWASETLPTRAQGLDGAHVSRHVVAIHGIYQLNSPLVGKD